MCDRELDDYSDNNVRFPGWNCYSGDQDGGAPVESTGVSPSVEVLSLKGQGMKEQGPRVEGAQRQPNPSLALPQDEEVSRGVGGHQGTARWGGEKAQ